MFSGDQLTQFLSEIDDSRRQLTRLVPPDSDGSTPLRVEIADLNEQLLVADEELRTQPEPLDAARTGAEAGGGYTRFLDASPHPLVLTDKDGTVLQASRGALALVQRPADMASRPIATWFTGDGRHAVRMALLTLQSRPAEIVDLGRLLLRRADHTDETVEVSVTVTLRPHGSGARLLWHLYLAVPPTKPLLNLTSAEADQSGNRDDGITDRLVPLTTALSRAETTWDVLEEVARQAASFFPQTSSADIFVPRTIPYGGGRREPLLGIFEELQHELGEGPSVDAVDGKPIRSDHLPTDPRWPQLAAQLAQTDVRSALAVPLYAGQIPHAAVVWISDRTAAFDEHDATAGNRFAVRAGLGLQRVLLTEQLRTAIRSQQQFGQAIGMLMGRYRISQEQAFVVLRAISQRTGSRVRDVAAQVSETGELPDVPGLDAARVLGQRPQTPR